MQKPRKIEIHVNQAGMGRVLVDNIDLSHLVYRVEFVAHAGELPKAVLHLHPSQVDVNGSSAVLIDNLTADPEETEE